MNQSNQSFCFRPYTWYLLKRFFFNLNFQFHQKEHFFTFLTRAGIGWEFNNNLSSNLLLVNVLLFRFGHWTKLQWQKTLLFTLSFTLSIFEVALDILACLCGYSRWWKITDFLLALFLLLSCSSSLFWVLYKHLIAYVT